MWAMPDPTSAEGPIDLPDLLARSARGEEEAWRRLIGLYARRVYALARSRCRRDDLAEEVTQSVFATLAAKLGTEAYRERGRFEAWLFRVAMNRVRDEMRRISRHAPAIDPEKLAAVPEPRPAVRASSEDVARLREALEWLGETDRQVVELRHHSGMSFKDIADLLDEPLGTVLARHHRALRKLKERLEDAPSRMHDDDPRTKGDA